MKTFLYWLCRKGFHRGDMTWMPLRGSTLICKTCGETQQLPGMLS